MDSNLHIPIINERHLQLTAYNSWTDQNISKKQHEFAKNRFGVNSSIFRMIQIITKIAIRPHIAIGILYTQSLNVLIYSTIVDIIRI